jgi:predicted acetyltransferase
VSVGAVTRLMRTCFGVPEQDAGHIIDLLGAESFSFEPADSVEPDAMLSTWRMEQWFGGAPVPCEAVAFVGVDPPARGKGAASGLLLRSLRRARESGAALATLYPAALPLYEKLGFARAGINRRLRCAPSCFAPARRDSPPLRRMEPVDADALAALRLTTLREGNGGVTRTEAMWALALHPDGRLDVDVYVIPGVGGGLEGYIVLVPPGDDRLVVADHCLPTPRSMVAAHGLLASYRSRVDQIVWTAPPDDPLLHGLIDATLEVEDWEEWMLRVLNVPAALAARGWPPNLKVAFTLFVNDPYFPENEGPWEISISDGRGFVTRTDEQNKAHIRSSSNALAALFSGCLDAAALRRMGRLEADDRHISLLNAAFSGSYPFLADHF